MKTQDIKDHLQTIFAWTGKWKRIRKWKNDGCVMRIFENSSAPGATVMVNTGKNDDRVIDLSIFMLGKPPATSPQTGKSHQLQTGKGYFYTFDDEEVEECEVLDDQGGAVPAECVLCIGTYPNAVDDHHGKAQDFLEPIFENILGRDCLEDTEGQFFLAPGEAAKLEPVLIRNGWKKGQW
jgi:hypothetical protein